MAKYDSLRKTNRNHQLLEFRKRNPDFSLKEIGKVFDISESRVSKILKKYKPA